MTNLNVIHIRFMVVSLFIYFCSGCSPTGLSSTSIEELKQSTVKLSKEMTTKERSEFIGAISALAKIKSERGDRKPDTHSLAFLDGKTVEQIFRLFDVEIKSLMKQVDENNNLVDVELQVERDTLKEKVLRFNRLKGKGAPSNINISERVKYEEQMLSINKEMESLKVKLTEDFSSAAIAANMKKIEENSEVISKLKASIENQQSIVNSDLPKDELEYYTRVLKEHQEDYQYIVSKTAELKYKVENRGKVKIDLQNKIERLESEYQKISLTLNDEDKVIMAYLNKVSHYEEEIKQSEEKLKNIKSRYIDRKKLLAEIKKPIWGL